MKKIFMLLLVATFIGGAASAQTTKKEEMKSKPTTTIPQKVHNVVRPKHKHYSGHKSKHKVMAKKD